MRRWLDWRSFGLFMYDYHHFNNPRLLKDHFEKLEKIAAEVIVHREAVEDYEGAIEALSIMARACGFKVDGLVVEAAEKVKETYLNGL